MYAVYNVHELGETARALSACVLPARALPARALPAHALHYRQESIPEKQHHWLCNATNYVTLSTIFYTIIYHFGISK